MNTREKILLLSELFDVDVSKHIPPVLNEIEKSSHYKTLVINVEMASKYQVPYTEQFLKEYEDLSINKISSIRDAYIARAKVDYLYYISQPKYFINPIMFNPMEMATDITTLGELPCYYHGQEKTLNEIVMSNQITPKEKIKTTTDLVRKWGTDAKETIIDQINLIVNKKHKKSHTKSKSIFRRGLVFPLSIILGNILFWFSIFSSFSWFAEIINGQYVTSYMFLFFTIFLFLFETMELIDSRIDRNFFSEKIYCYKYLKSHAYLAVKNLDDSVIRIKKAINESIKSKTSVVTPITKVNYLANFRRIILYLKTDKDIRNHEYKESTINAIHIIHLELFVIYVLFFLAYVFMLVFSAFKGGVI